MIKGLGQQTACVRYNILSSAMDILLLFFLLPLYGIEGYFASFFVTHLINFALSYRRLLKLTGRLMAPAVPVLLLAATGISIFLADLLSSAAEKAAAFVLLQGSLLVLLRIVSMEDVQWLKGLLLKK